jgi:hypothetical protein
VRVEPRSGWTPNERKRATLTLLPCPDVGRAGALRAPPPFDKTTITAAGKVSCVCVLVRPCKARCVWVWEEHKKEKRESVVGEEKQEGKTKNRNKRVGRVGKEKEKEEEGRWTRAPAAAPRRRHLCQ